MFFKNIFLASSIFLLTNLVSADVVNLAADYWMPFNGNPNDDRPGYMVEIAKNIFEKKGHTIQYFIVPFARAITDAREGRIQGVVGAAVADLPDFLFPKEEQGMLRMNLYVKKGNPFKYQGITSLKNIRLAVIRDYSYFELDEYIKNAISSNNTNVEIFGGEHPLEQILKLIHQNKIGVVPEDASVLNYVSAQMNLSGEFVSVGKITEAKLFIAFPPQNPKSKEYSKLLEDGMRDLRSSGELQKILSKYQIKDWQK